MTAVALDLRADVERLIKLGAVLLHQGDADEAEACWDHAVAVANESPDPMWETAHWRLTRGDYERGFQDYECRFQQPWYPERPLNVPRWNGEPLDGTLYLWAEQGLGDTLMLLRYVDMTRTRCRRVVLELPKALIPFVHRRLDFCDRIDVVGFNPAPTGIDAHLPMFSLPFVFGTILDTVPPQERIRHRHDWTDREIPDDVIGLCWSRAPWQPDDVEQAERTLPAEQVTSLLAALGRPVLSLQSTAPVDAREVDAILDRLAQCSAVVTVDRWIAHLAGLLGIPTHLVLHRIGEWRWGRGRSSPWHPTAVMHRQPTLGDWPGALDSVVTALS